MAMYRSCFVPFLLVALRTGLTETQRSVSWGLAGLEHDLIGLDTSYSYEFETLAEKLTGFTEDYSYTFSYEV